MNRINRNSAPYKLINPDHVNKLVTGITDRRAKALVLLILDTGLRAGEIIKLDRDSITYDSCVLPDGSVRTTGTGQVFHPHSHGSRTFYVSARTVAALTEYLAKDRGDDGVPALFATKNGRLHSAAILRMLYRSCDLVGIERIGAHDLRRYFASMLINRGVSPMPLYRLLGLQHPNAWSGHTAASVVPHEIFS